MNVSFHVAQNASGRSPAIDGRTIRHGSYAAVSPRIRKHIEQAFGWIKTVAGEVGRWRIVEMEVTAISFDRVEGGRLTFQGKSDGETPFGALKDFLDLRYRSACAEVPSSC